MAMQKHFNNQYKSKKERENNNKNMKNQTKATLHENIAIKNQKKDAEGEATLKNTSNNNCFQLPAYKQPSVWPEYNGFWKNVLYIYIKNKNERDYTYNECIFYEDNDFIVIYDRFFKAKIHLLIMPKIKFQSIYELNPLNNYHIKMIERIIQIAEWIKNDILKRNKNIINIKYGFHAVPTLNQMHCHLISGDMDSQHMKKTKHYNSFNTQYFVPANILLKTLKIDKRKFTVDKKYYKNVFYNAKKLKCQFCFREFEELSDVKLHIKRCIQKYKKIKPQQKKHLMSQIVEQIDDCILTVQTSLDKQERENQNEVDIEFKQRESVINMNISVGTHCVLHGLNMTSNNGKLCKIIGKFNVKEERYPVYVFENKEPVLIKPCNLKIVNKKQI
eukprot:218502_1